jgi:hypothetical protein
VNKTQGAHKPTKLHGNRGGDGAWVFHDPAGKVNGIDVVVDIIITESKFATGGGFPKLARTTDMVQQLSPAWMKKHIDALKDVHPGTYKILNEILIKTALETPLSLLRDLEITRQPGTMGMAGEEHPWS